MKSYLFQILMYAILNGMTLNMLHKLNNFKLSSKFESSLKNPETYFLSIENNTNSNVWGTSKKSFVCIHILEIPIIGKYKVWSLQ